MIPRRDGLDRVDAIEGGVDAVLEDGRSKQAREGRTHDRLISNRRADGGLALAMLSIRGWTRHRAPRNRSFHDGAATSLRSVERRAPRRRTRPRRVIRRMHRASRCPTTRRIPTPGSTASSSPRTPHRGELPRRAHFARSLSHSTPEAACDMNEGVRKTSRKCRRDDNFPSLRERRCRSYLFTKSHRVCDSDFRTVRGSHRRKRGPVGPRSAEGGVPTR